MNDFDNKQIYSYKDIDRFGFTCDVCGRKVNGCHIVNGMSFCEKCYQETFRKDNQQEDIKQLKQQLAEKDKEIEKLRFDVQRYANNYRDIVLKHTVISNAQQLMSQSDFVEWLNSYRNRYGVIGYVDPTQFAIQKLEKVKELLLVENKNNPIVYDINDDTVGGALDRDKTFEIIDQQIKELKGE